MKQFKAISRSIALLAAALRLASAQVVGFWPFTKQLPGDASDTVGNSILDARGNGRHGTTAPEQQNLFYFALRMLNVLQFNTRRQFVRIP